MASSQKVLDAQPDSFKVCIGELGNTSNVMHPIDEPGDLEEFRVISSHVGRNQCANKTITFAAVRSQLASFSLSKSTSATGTCQSCTGGGLAVGGTDASVWKPVGHMGKTLP